MELQILGKKQIFPNVKTFEYLFNISNNMGFFSHSDNGIIPITYTEIKSYLEITKTKINKYELRLIKDLSIIYVNTYYESKNKDFEQPYKED